MLRTVLSLLLLSVFLSACASGLPFLAPTPTPTPSPVPTVTPTPIPTVTALPEPVKQDILQTYKILTLIQVNVEVINTSAARIQSGELSGNDSLGAILASAALVNAVDQIISASSRPEILSQEWGQASAVHEQSKDILGRWFNQDIKSPQVIEEVAVLTAEMEKIMRSTDAKLADMQGVDPEELARIRKETLDSMEKILNTPVP